MRVQKKYYMLYLKISNVCSIIKTRCWRGIKKYERVIAVDERKDDVLDMTNEEYREELVKIFESIHENYKLRWFYIFITEKLRSS